MTGSSPSAILTTSSFTLRALPGTDIWRKPPHTDTFNAPRLLGSSTPLSRFTRTRITFSAHWTQQYDQGGLLLLITSPTSAFQQKWIKTGIEFYNFAPRLSTVACDNWADWSIYPLPPNAGDSVTVEVRREADELGRSLWVYYLNLDEAGNVVERVPLREVTWLFAGRGGSEEEDDAEVRVGAYAARPAPGGGEGGQELEVTFSGFEEGE